MKSTFSKQVYLMGRSYSGVGGVLAGILALVLSRFLWVDFSD
jgi:hypothetical protein